MKRAGTALFACRFILCIVLPSALPACVKLPRSSTDVAGMQHAGAETGPKISLNRATRSELEKLPGVGPGLAARIIEHRERYGPFRRVEHLLLVRGFGERRYHDVRPFITAE